jgi:hypothetical protein
MNLIARGRGLFDDSRTISDYKIYANDLIHIQYRQRGSIGIFDSQHLGSVGRAWLMKS